MQDQKTEPKLRTVKDILNNVIENEPKGVVVLAVEWGDGKGVRVQMDFANVPTVELVFALKAFEMQISKLLDRQNTPQVVQ